MAKRKRGKPVLPRDVDWPEATRKWFNAWRDSPRTDGWDQEQWMYMFDTALVHAEVWGSGNTGLVSELHRRLSYMGLDFQAPRKAADSPTATVLKMVVSDRAAKHERARNAS